MTTLKDGSSVGDPRLGRLKQFDERSRGFTIREVVPKRPRSYTWRLKTPYVIDQGQEGACVGFAMANELQARPAEVDLGSEYQATRFSIESVYWRAQRIDPWDGGAYPGASPFYEGTSILAGVKATKWHGFFSEYRWSFGIQDLVLGLGHNGPAVLGVLWFDSMYRPDGNHFIKPEGSVVGGHAILARAVKLAWKRSAKWNWWTRTWEDVDLDKSYVTLRNSWGPGYGKNGDCYITLRSLEELLRHDGEAVFFLERTARV